MEQVAIHLSVIALAVSLADAAWLTFALATRRYQRAASSLTATLLVGLLLLVAGASWIASESFPWPRPEQLISLTAVGSWWALRLQWAKQFAAGLDWAPWQFGIVSHVLLIAATGSHFYLSTLSSRSDDFEPYVQKGVAADDAVLITDQGRVFPLFHFDLQGQTYEDTQPFTHVTAAELAQLSDARRPVRIALTDPRSNCHGWVFTGGRYGVSETVVDALLQDNGYQLVDEPLAGDVIVYRDASKVVLHTGRVHRVHENGEIWIESKWGPGGRYFHLPQDQGYSNNIEYYRSPRPGRYAQIVSTAKRNETGTLASVASLPRRPLRRASL